jgi:hypothetical protein
MLQTGTGKEVGPPVPGMVAQASRVNRRPTLQERARSRSEREGLPCATPGEAIDRGVITRFAKSNRGRTYR